ncbi:RNA-binding S4 domain-containing protein [Sphingobacterium sp. SRCM116780]|uniref:RNA-binding S4 domain-containing protein n=1 Tax=Sphingobacterium sp. SRCM116780 TaxID=2907623 RepID=UPI001F3B3A7D|nr:RNA-binding S4 domain-containing protein [Sphingobacterium sp. SRCM116780]UIR55596.1 RNA-binding S4 domain-containing protein [Sphingobacterium sp. SRCM116780]
MTIFVQMAAETEKLRIDKYLWSIRLFKTRSLATDACKAGRVKLNGQNIKASYVVKIGDIYQVQKGIERKIVKVLGLLERRVDAKTAVQFYEDQTPEEETTAFKSVFQAPILKRDRGTGRPTKRDRREIDDLKTDWWEEEG